MVVMLLSGCGFEPIYGAREGYADVDDLLSEVQISIIEDREGQILRNHLLDRFYLSSPSKRPLYRLDVRLNSSIGDLSVRADDETTRRQVVLDASYTLTDIRAEKVVYSDASRLRGAFNVSQGAYASFATERAVLQRSLRDMSELIALRVSAFLRRFT